MGDTILVTGTGGFLGRRLVPRLLNRGDQVVCIDRNASLVSSEVESYTGDLARSNVLDEVRAPVTGVVLT